MDKGSIKDQVRARVEKESKQRAEKAQRQSRRQAGDAVDSRFVRDCLYANQLGDGLLFSGLHDGRFIQNKSSGDWLAWVGHHWERDETCRALASVENVAQRYLQEAQEIVKEIDWAMQKKDTKQAKSLKEIQEDIYKRVSRLRTENGRTNCLKFAATNLEHPLEVKGDVLDQEPWLLACKNGVIDLRTGELAPGKPANMISKASKIEYEGIEAPAPIWEETLMQIFDGDDQLVKYLNRLMGYAITGLTTENILPILWGQGRNGKTTIVELISHVLNDMARPIQSEMLLDQGRVKNSAGPSPDVMALRGLRIAFGSEADEGRRFSPSRVKWLSGGDSLVGRAPHDKYETYFAPTHTLILLTNHTPHAPPNDFAFWQRVHLIPFPLSFVDRAPQKDNERRVDKRLPDKLKGEAAGILSWLVRGCLRWQEIGLSPPQIIVDATAKYQRDEDTLADFLDECCHIDPLCETPATSIYDAFKEWFAENVSKRTSISQKKFGKLMGERFEKFKRGHNFYKGLRLLT
ncbi:MAG: phage/plasmid primase, P4 family [Thermodesulfobacteriota bacterium]|nr:phage/plasmid primase, P4 family [Thermodesulfobacteriota bacterium]